MDERRADIGRDIDAALDEVDGRHARRRFFVDHADMCTDRWNGEAAGSAGLLDGVTLSSSGRGRHVRERPGQRLGIELDRLIAGTGHQIDDVGQRTGRQTDTMKA
jgi:hypothetical protein